MSLMGLDIGTTGCKCTIFDPAGKVLAYAYQEYPTERPRPGWSEINPATVWDAAVKVIRETVTSYQEAPVAAISISSIGEAAVPVDRDGKVLGNSILCIDSRGREQCLRLEEKLGREKIMKTTGIPSHPMYTVNKIMWIKENQPEIYRRTWKFMLFEDYVIYRLTGNPVIDYSLASRTMAFNVVEMNWEEEIFEAADINPGLFSTPAPSATVVDTVSRKIAREVGLSPRTKVVTGGHDQACAALGAGILKAGLAVDGIGTVECITPAFDRPLRTPEMMKHNFNCAPHAKQGLYAAYAFNFTGGSLLKWYRDCFAGHEVEQAKLTGENVYARLDRKAAGQPTSLLVLPHFAGAGTPYMNPKAKGAILGLTFDHTAADIYRAMLEGVTYEMAYNLECLQQAGVEIDTLRAVGGGAKSDLWLQIKADIMQRPVEKLDIDEAGTLGTAIMAGVAGDIYASMNEAVANLVRVKQTFYPNQNNRQLYQQKYQCYKKIYDQIKEIIQPA